MWLVSQMLAKLELRRTLRHQTWLTVIPVFLYRVKRAMVSTLATQRAVDKIDVLLRFYNLCCLMNS